jgi:hypothetical protein
MIFAASANDKMRQKPENLIPLHFGNPELHNKLLASQHPNVG